MTGHTVFILAAAPAVNGLGPLIQGPALGVNVGANGERIHPLFIAVVLSDLELGRHGASSRGRHGIPSFPRASLCYAMQPHHGQ